MADVKLTEFNGIKDCISIQDGGTEAILSTRFGPRVLLVTKSGKANLLAFFPEHLKLDKKGFIGYGGHRVWHAPEVGGRTNLPDNEPCRYELTKNGANVFSANNKTNLSSGLAVAVNGDGTFSVDNIIENTGLFDIELSVWGITQFAAGGVLAVPQSGLDTGFAANRTITLWPYSKTTDKRAYYGDKYITVKSDGATAEPFKFGTNCDARYAAYFYNGQLVIKKFSYYYGAEYPNFCCNFESYTNSKFIEIESLSPLLTLEAGEAESHGELWYIFDNVGRPDFKNEEQISELLEKPLKAIGL